MRRQACYLIAGVLVLTIAYAASGLNVKVGLWEVSYTTKTEGSMVSKSALEAMPPDRRARVEAAMRQQAAAPSRTHTSRNCITEKDLQQGAFDAGPDGDCKKTLVSQTATHQEVKFVCTEDGETRTGHMTVDANSTSSMQGVIEVATADGKVSMQMSGKWLGASCAGVAKH